MASSGNGARRARAAAIALAILCVRVAAADRIQVSRDATVSGTAIQLGDLAVLEGARAEALSGLHLGQAPVVGESRMLDGHAVLAALRREAGDLDGITYSIPPTIRVRRATQEVGEAAVRSLIESFLVEALGAGAGDAVLRTVELSGPVRLPAGAYTARVVPPAGVPLLGRVRFELAFAVDGRPVRSAWVVADIGLYGPVVVVTRPIARGETLGAGDVTVDQRDLSEVPRGIVSDLAEATGRVARAALVPYTPIRRDQIESPVAVHRGDVVLLVAEQGPLRITAPGEVRGDASLGEQVHVTNRISRKDVVGRVVDASTVVVEF
jgi:flagella basal body P-ring formation protein FlgA